MSWQQIREGTRKARKEHRCFHCGEKIKINEVYYFNVIFTSCSSQLQEIKFHLECQEATRQNNRDIYIRVCQDEALEEGMFTRGTLEFIKGY